MKKELNINLEEYFKWYANWLEKDIEDIKNGKYKFTMFDEWLETKSIDIKDSIGKEIYFPINAEHKNEITSNTYLEGVLIRKGTVEEIKDNQVKIDRTNYSFNKFDTTSYFFFEKDLLLATLHYDGSSIYHGNILCIGYSSDLIEEENEI